MYELLSSNDLIGEMPLKTATSNIIHNFILYNILSKIHIYAVFLQSYKTKTKNTAINWMLQVSALNW